MTEATTQLERVGDALQTAWRADHLRGQRTRLRRPRRLALVLALTATVVGAGAAIAAGVLKTVAEEQQGIVQGHQLFEGNQPNCESLTATSFRCTLAKPPTGMTFYDKDGRVLLDRFLGVTTLTVDSTGHVDGACVSISSGGREWNCFLGQDAVTRGLLSPQLLGTYQPDTPTG